jgi:hypothetical protein
MKIPNTKILTYCLLFIAPLFLVGSSLQAQCTSNTSAFGTSDAPVYSGVVEVESCNWATEYFTINNAVAGETYEFTSSISTDYLTAVEGNPSTGNVIGSGTTPLQVTATTNGTIYVHVNLNSNCDTGTGCRVTTIECVNCPDAPPGYCDLGPISPDWSQLVDVQLSGVSMDIDWTWDCPGQTGVTDATSEVADVFPGGTYDLTNVYGNCNTGNWAAISKIWVDWNEDFEFDANEAISDWDGMVSVAGTEVTHTFTVPSDASPGTKTMRILLWETSAWTPDDIDDPCVLPGTIAFTWGTVADFTIEVVEAPDCEITMATSVFEVDNDPGECGAFVSIPSPIIIGNCDTDPINDYNNTGNATDFYPVGTTEVTFTVPGTAASVTFEVIVEDVEPIQVVCPSDINVTLSPEHVKLL